MGGIVLAGGRSRRMGMDKSLLTHEGVTLAEHTARVLSDVAGQTVVVVDDPEKLRLPSRFEVVSDSYPGAGPLGGLLTGLRRLPEGAHLVVACDMPYLVPELLRRLLERCQGFEAAVPLVDGRLQPLCAAYHSAVEPALAEAFAEGVRAPHAALPRSRCRVIEEWELRQVDPRLDSFINWNTPEDVRRWKGDSYE
jgi:molybdopterin-guanine dinucleotide biosynthesis protein A